MKWLKILFIIGFLAGSAACSSNPAISPTKTAQPIETPTQLPPILPASNVNLPLRIPVLILAYFPPDSTNPKHLDAVETGWKNTLITDMQKATKEMIDAGQSLINDATRYHGYKDLGAPQYLEYYTYQIIEYLYPIPRGYSLGDEKHRPHYNQILNNIDICGYVDNHGIKEVWIYGYHATVIIPDESKMSGGFGDISNANPKDEYIPEEFRLPRCTNTYVMYNFTYQPGGAQAIGNTIHNRMHQIENVVFYALEDLGYPVTEMNVEGSLFWDDFSVAWDRASLTGYRASCGNTHSPPNTTEGYDYDSIEYRENNCETWNPNDSLTTYVSANCTQWGCTDIGFYKWFMQNLPGYNNGIIYKGKPMPNWWDIMYDFNKFIDPYNTRHISPTPSITPTEKAVFEYPLDNQNLKYDGSWVFKVRPMVNSQGFMWGFFQNDVLVWENSRDEGTLSGNEYKILEGSPAHKKLVPGSVEVWVRAFINGEWKEASVIKINLVK